MMAFKGFSGSVSSIVSEVPGIKTRAKHFVQGFIGREAENNYQVREEIGEADRGASPDVIR